MQTLKDIPNFNDLMTAIPALKAVFWDMDGTLCNTEEVHALAGVDILSSLPGGSPFTLEELQNMSIGLTDTMVFQNLQSSGLLLNTDLDSFLIEKNEKFINTLKQIDSDKIFNTEILNLLNELKKHQIQLALVTSSEKATTDQVLGKLNLKKYFEIIITQEDTKLNKPAPSPYLLAMDKLKVSKEEVIIFEDSDAGLTAAKESGAQYFKAMWY